MSTINRCVSALVFGGLFLLGPGALSAATYYVSTSGNDSNTGLSEAMAWRTVGYAATKAVAGDTVYIKAGLYADTEEVVLTNSGTAAEPIVFEGYKTTPGDKPTYSKYKPGNTLDSTELPVINGGATGHICFYSWAKNHITVRNLGIASFNFGCLIEGDSTYVQFVNVFMDDIRMIGFYFRGTTSTTCTNHCTIQDCVATDSQDNNFFLWGVKNSTVSGCRSYTTDGSSSAMATDYHIVLSDSYNNTVSGCSAYNLHPSKTDPHPGHGIGVKDVYKNGGYPSPHSYGNLFINCNTYDVSVEAYFVAHAAYNNSFVSCNAYADYRFQSPTHNGICFRDGAHDNAVTDCRIDGFQVALTFVDTVEGPTTSQICASNTVERCVFTNSYKCIVISDADNNIVKNCVFNKNQSEFLRWYTTRTNTGNAMRNSIVTNCVGGYQQGSGSTLGITYSDFYSNGFATPGGTGNIAVDPLYADVANKDFHLKSTGGRWKPTTSSWVTDTMSSPCIDAGNPSDGYSTEPTPNGGRINIGAYGNTTQASKTGRSPTRPTGRTPAVPSRDR